VPRQEQQQQQQQQQQDGLVVVRRGSKHGVTARAKQGSSCVPAAPSPATSPGKSICSSPSRPSPSPNGARQANKKQQQGSRQQQQQGSRRQQQQQQGLGSPAGMKSPTASKRRQRKQRPGATDGVSNELPAELVQLAQVERWLLDVNMLAGGSPAEGGQRQEQQPHGHCLSHDVAAEVRILNASAVEFGRWVKHACMSLYKYTCSLQCPRPIHRCL
jgi:hypothetical protein